MQVIIAMKWCNKHLVLHFCLKLQSYNLEHLYKHCHCNLEYKTWVYSPRHLIINPSLKVNPLLLSWLIVSLNSMCIYGCISLYVCISCLLNLFLIYSKLCLCIMMPRFVYYEMPRFFLVNILLLVNRPSLQGIYLEFKTFIL